MDEYKVLIMTSNCQGHVTINSAIIRARSRGKVRMEVRAQGA
jgi:hypothetical protein